MKAIVYHEYGSPEVLEFRDIDKPEIKDDEVLVRVPAAGIPGWYCGCAFSCRVVPQRVSCITSLIGSSSGT